MIKICKVAETFTFNLLEEEKDESHAEKNETMSFLKDIARIDTCVTVADACNFFDHFNTAEILTEKFMSEKPAETDERTVTELMID